MKAPLVQTVEVIGPTGLRITWSTGEVLPVDLAEPISRFKALAPLRDRDFFARASRALGSRSRMVRRS